MVWHTDRHWGISTIQTATELASLLTEHSWTLCTGFRWNGYLFLNDATSEDGAQEFAVIREADMAQVESITASWMSRERMLDFLTTQLGATDFSHSYGTVDRRRIHELKTHHGCYFCT